MSIREVTDPRFENIEEKVDEFEVVESRMKIAEHSKAWEEHQKTHENAKLHMLDMPGHEPLKEESSKNMSKAWEEQTAKSDLSQSLHEEGHPHHEKINLGCNCGQKFMMDPVTNVLKEKNPGEGPASGYDIGNKEEKDNGLYKGGSSPSEGYKGNSSSGTGYQG